MSELTRRQFGLGLLGAAAAGCAAERPEEKPEEKTEEKRAASSAMSDVRGTPGELPPFPSDVHEERLDRLRQAMKLEGTSALLLGPTLNLTYFTGVSWSASERLFGCVVFERGAPVWIAPKFEEARARESTEGKGELRTWEEWDDPHALIVETVSARAPRGKLAVDSHLRSVHALRIARALGAERAVDGLPVTARVRSCKTPPEVARIRRACEITQEAIRIARERVIEPGVGEGAVSAAISEAQRKLGLSGTWCLALFGSNAAFPHGTGHRRTLAEGDLVLVDCGGGLEGYQSDITRTFAFGRPTERQRSVYRLVRNAHRAALRAAKPGVKCEAVDAAARQVIADGGFGPGARYFTHRLGHGIGLEGHEDPYFCPGNATILAPGMTLSDEPGIYVPGELGVRIEDVVAITPDGAELLGVEPADEI